MLAGRKLLLADDSITIQKVVALTFADEGVEVVAVSDGREAVEKLEEVAPDIVLADVFMPAISGYEVCEYIKQNAKLRHIPVMLLVGSFEPFDEAEARRVGADDILTKPFQSIRRLIDKVGGLVTGKPAADEVPTAELPQVEKEDDTERLSTEELAISTADTQPLPIEDERPDETAPQIASAQATHQGMNNTVSEWRDESSVDKSDVLLELGDLGNIRSQASDFSPDEFVLDIDLEEAETVQVFEAASSSSTRAFVEPQLSQPTVVGWDIKREQPRFSEPARAQESSTSIDDQMAKTQEWVRDDARSEKAAKLERVVDEPETGERSSIPSALVDANQLPPEVIDAIARRAVEHLSERVVQEIAWEVVPQLAELLIKRKLEEQESQPK